MNHSDILCDPEHPEFVETWAQEIKDAFERTGLRPITRSTGFDDATCAMGALMIARGHDRGLAYEVVDRSPLFAGVMDAWDGRSGTGPSLYLAGAHIGQRARDLMGLS